MAKRKETECAVGNRQDEEEIKVLKGLDFTIGRCNGWKRQSQIAGRADLPSLFVLDEVQCLQSPKKEYRMNEGL